MVITRLNAKEKNRRQYEKFRLVNPYYSTRNIDLKNANSKSSMDSSPLRRSKRETPTRKVAKSSAIPQKSRQSTGTKNKLKKRNSNLSYNPSQSGKEVPREESLNSFNVLVGHTTEPTGSPSMDLQKITQKCSIRKRKSSVRIAKEFQKVKRLSYENKCQSGDGKCDGRAFFECLSEYHKKPSDFDDLVDFIECQDDKDYSSWMKNRYSCRQWKHTRWATQVRARRIMRKMKSFGLQMVNVGRKKGIIGRKIKPSDMRKTVMSRAQKIAKEFKAYGSTVFKRSKGKRPHFVYISLGKF